MRPQMRIEAIAKAARHEMFCNVAMRDLPERMNPGVGAAGAVHPYGLAADRLDCILKRALHRGPVVLQLPAAEWRAVIFDDEFVAGHLDPGRRSQGRLSSSAKADDQYSATFQFKPGVAAYWIPRLRGV